MESNKKKPEWWEDPVADIRSRLVDLSNRHQSDEFPKDKPTKSIEKVFFKSKVRSTSKCQK